MTDEAWAKSLLEGIQKVKDKANQDERSTAAYWNCDDWGSISGIRDAREWVDGQVIEYVLKRVRERDEERAKATKGGRAPLGRKNLRRST